jgi:hypothetical protein
MCIHFVFVCLFISLFVPHSISCSFPQLSDTSLSLCSLVSYIIYVFICNCFGFDLAGICHRWVTQCLLAAEPCVELPQFVCAFASRLALSVRVFYKICVLLT